MSSLVDKNYHSESLSFYGLMVSFGLLIIGFSLIDKSRKILYSLDERLEVR